jgi:NAD(P)-dependent dehydrogenase (short-subunit alcohol dehydrogenase family)
MTKMSSSLHLPFIPGREQGRARTTNGRAAFRVAVVTGASAGVGRATALLLARRGAAVALVARGTEGLDGARREVEAAGGRALTVQADVADAAQVEQAAGTIERELGPIDAWINNAMASVFSPFAQMTPEEFRRVTDVTYLGYVYGTMAALKRMRARGRGVIVQVGSALAYRAIPLQSAYCGAKHAVEGFTEALRCELLHDRSPIKLAMVHLPALNTPQFGWVKSRLAHKAQPVPPIFQPELAAEVIVWAAEHPRREVYVTFPTWFFTMANRFAPSVGDWYLARTGYQSQQTQEPEDPGRPDNLWRPVGEDRGTHGTFDHRAHRRSLQVWATTHRGWVALAAGAALAGYAWLR